MINKNNKAKVIVVISLFIMAIFGSVYMLFNINKDMISNNKNTLIDTDKIFEDNSLQNCVLNSYNNHFKKQKTSLTESDLEKIEELTCQDLKIESAKGIEKLVNLTYLDLSTNKIAKIDLSNLKKLKFIALDDNFLTDIDLNNNVELEEINIPCNNLKTVNLSKNIELINLNLTYNEIETIDLSNNSKLNFIDLSFNKLEKINVSNNSLLTQLYLANNKLTEINVSNNKKLKTLNIYQGNSIEKGKIIVGSNKYIIVS